MMYFLQKYQAKAVFWARVLGHLPGVRSIFLSGSLAQGRGREDSDIDFFIVADTNRIWTARFFVFMVLKFSGQLAKPTRHAGKICPNHFVTVDALEIKEKDNYAAHMFSRNKPLWDPYGVFPHFAHANAWVTQFGHRFEVLKTPLRPITYNLKNNPDIFERLIGYLQIRKVERNLEYQYAGSKIVLLDNELRFHPVPKNRVWKTSKR